MRKIITGLSLLTMMACDQPNMNNVKKGTASDTAQVLTQTPIQTSDDSEKTNYEKEYKDLSAEKIAAKLGIDTEKYYVEKYNYTIFLNDKQLKEIVPGILKQEYGNVAYYSLVSPLSWEEGDAGMVKMNRRVDGTLKARPRN